MAAKINKNTKFLLKQEFARGSPFVVIVSIPADMHFEDILPQSNGSKKG